MKLCHSKIVLISAVLVTTGAWAHSGASGVVKQRMDMMGDIADQMKTVGQMLNGKNAFDSAAAESAARKVAGHAHGFEMMFPEGSIEPPSEALPAIWDNWNAFLDISTTMEARALELADTAAGASAPDDLKAPFGQLAGTCKACHQDFRLKK